MGFWHLIEAFYGGGVAPITPPPPPPPTSLSRFKNHGPGDCCCDDPGGGPCNFMADYFDDRANEDDVRWAQEIVYGQLTGEWKIDLAGQFLYCTGPNPAMIGPPQRFNPPSSPGLPPYRSFKIEIMVEGPNHGWIGFQHQQVTGGPGGLNPMWFGLQIGGPFDGTNYYRFPNNAFLFEPFPHGFGRPEVGARYPTRVYCNSRLVPDVINLITIEHTLGVNRWFVNGNLIAVTDRLAPIQYSPGAPSFRIFAWPGTRTNLGLSPFPAPYPNTLLLEESTDHSEYRQSNGPIKIHSFTVTYGLGEAFDDVPNPDDPCPYYYWEHFNEWRQPSPWRDPMPVTINATWQGSPLNFSWDVPLIEGPPKQYERTFSPPISIFVGPNPAEIHRVRVYRPDRIQTAIPTGVGVGCNLVAIGLDVSFDGGAVNTNYVGFLASNIEQLGNLSGKLVDGGWLLVGSGTIG